MHPLLPLLLLAGIGVQAIWDARARWTGRLGLARRASLCVLYTGYASWWANVENGADPREFLVTTQSSEQVKGVRDEVVAAVARARREGRDARILVDTAEGATFPWAWYFRDLDVGYLDLTTRRSCPPTPTSCSLTEASRDAAARPARRLRRRAASRSASGGCATTARCRRAAGGAGSRAASRGTRPAGCRSGSTCARARERAERSSSPAPHVRARRGRSTRRPSASHFATPASP